ncbi:hypothetical protein D3C77_318330 [compost metagenome]
MLVAEFGFPVRQLALAFATFQPLALPDTVIQVLHRQRQQRRLTFIDKGFIQLTQLTGKDVHGPAFSDDVVQGQDKVVLLFASLDQAGSQQRAALQVERLMRLLIGKGLQTLLALGRTIGRKVLPVHVQVAVTVHTLVRHAVNARERCAQGLMAHNQRLQGLFETADIQHTAQPRHAADVVGRAVRLHLPEEPHALLGVGQRHGLTTIDACNLALQIVRATVLDALDRRGKSAQLTGIKQHAQRQLDIAGLTGAGNDLGRQQRMTT